jgi:hypothetical protein
MRKAVAAATIAGSLIAGGVIGAVAFAPSLVGAQTSTPDQNVTTPHSNEDPAHEAGESADREAAEDSGQFHWGGGHGPNEDPAHEASESPEREAAEDSGQFGGGAGQSQTGASPIAFHHR